MEMPDGKRFRIGSGLSDALRGQPPPIGTYITYRYQHLTKNGLPRFPRYLRVREDF
jgi:DNA ligase-1